MGTTRRPPHRPVFSETRLEVAISFDLDFSDLSEQTKTYLHSSMECVVLVPVVFGEFTCMILHLMLCENGGYPASMVRPADGYRFVVLWSAINNW
jgi:hypothetical protein